MKAITVIASPRMEGNCRKIVDSITEGINENNGENKIYYVDKIDIKPCQACGGCRNPEKPSKCVINDDFRKIMDEVEDADCFIFASPNYFGEINAQGHIFMDRFYSMTKNTSTQLKGNQKAVIVFTYGAPTGTYDEYINSRVKIFESIGLNVVEVMSVGGNKPSSGDSEDVYKKARDIGLNL